MCSWPLLLLWALLPGATAGGSGWTLPHRTLLDSEGKYWLSWGPQDGRLAFRLEVRTAGYVGFGFSPTGAMASADIVVGGVADGRPYLQVSASPPGVRPSEPPPVLTPEQARVQGPPGPLALPLVPAERRRPPVAPRTPPLPSAPAPPGVKGARRPAPCLRRRAPSFCPEAEHG